MPLDSDYVLGTHDEEIARLGIQHQVWRPHMLDAWARAGMTRGSSADQLQRDFRESARNPNAVMMTPLVLEIIAEKQ